MNYLQLQAASGPLSNLRTEELYTLSDPLRYRPDFRYEFEMQILDLHDFDYVITHWVAGRKIGEEICVSEESGVLGSGFKRALERAAQLREDFSGAAVDVVVEMTHQTVPVFLPEEKVEAFYSRDVKLFRAPARWWRRDETRMHMGIEETEEVWRNGELTERGRAVPRLFRTLVEGDLGADRRLARIGLADFSDLVALDAARG